MRVAIRWSTNQRMRWLVAMNWPRTTQRSDAHRVRSPWPRCVYQNNPLSSTLFYKEEEKAIYEDGTFPEFRFVRWHDAGVDVLPNPGSSTVRSVDGETPSFAHEDTIAGDAETTDYELISSVGYVAMGNASPVKEVAKFVYKRLQFGRFLRTWKIRLDIEAKIGYHIIHMRFCWTRLIPCYSGV